MHKNSILLAITCYNCAPQISRVIQKIDDSLLERIEEIMIIDNDSSDDTILAAKKAIAERATQKFSVFKNNQNVNLGGSHKVAFLYAMKKGYDAVAILHGDDQATPSELHQLIDSLEKHPEAAAILGARFLSNSRLHGYAPSRIWGNRILNFLFTLITFRKTVDLGSGINIFRLAPLKDKRFLKFHDTLTFNVDLLLDYYRKKLPLQCIPITWSEDDQISNARNFKVARMMATQLFAWRFRINEKQYEKMTVSETLYQSTKQ